MKHAIAISLTLLLAVGCNGKQQAASDQQSAAPGDLTVTTAFNPDPPKQGSEALTVTVKDASGAPVKGAVVKITTTMPTMSMSGPSTTATDNGDGTYSATLSLQYATSWHFMVVASDNGKTVRSEVIQEVK